MEAPADPKTAYDTARRELAAALQKKRAVDKSLVRFPFAPFFRPVSLLRPILFIFIPMSVFIWRGRWRKITNNKAMLEQNLYAFESSYLTETSMSGGNIITGFDAYLKPTGASKKRHEITDNDRIFSNSSFSVNRVM